METPGERLVIKMWESLIDKGIGSLLRPGQIRREGRAYVEVRRDEMLVLAEAERDAAAIRSGQMRLSTGDDGRLRALPVPQVSAAVSDTEPAQAALPAAVKTIGEGVIADGIRREVNVSKAIMAAEAELLEEKQAPPSRQIDTDWLFRWRDMASAVSTEELQTLWGRVLAGEVKSPGAFSLRTLEFLKNVSQEEAQSIGILSRFAAENFIFRGNDELLRAEGVHFGFLLAMQQLGVLSGVEASNLTLTTRSRRTDTFEVGIVCNDRILIVSDPNPQKTFTLHCCQLTDVGRQIIRLGHFEAHEGYLRSLGEHVKSQGFRVRLARLTHTDEDSVEYRDVVEL